MNIAFDAKRAFNNFTGLGNYSRTLIKGLIEYYPQNEYFLYSPKAESSEFDAYIQSKSNAKIITPPQMLPSIFNSTWRSFLVTNNFQKHDLDIFHGLSNELPIEFCKKSKTKKVVTIHDLIFLRYPNLYNKIDARIYKTKTIKACKVADVIIAISEQTKSDLIEFLNVPKQKIKVVYQSCGSHFYQNIEEDRILEFKKKHQLPNDFILNVGTIEDRKNLLGLVRAQSLSKSKIPLVVLGKKKEYFKKVSEFISANSLEKDVIFLDNVSYHELPILYQASKMFVFPSLFEGFGIPIIEALASGVPVITNKNYCFPEAGGPDSFYVNVENPQELANAIDELFVNKEKREKMAMEGLEFVKKFSLENTTKEVISLYHQIVKDAMVF